MVELFPPSKLMNRSFKSWLLTAAELPKVGAKIFLEQVPCPSCATCRLEFLYIAAEMDRIGYLNVWCSNCGIGIRISRVRVPASFEFSTFEQVEHGEIVPPAFEEVQA